MNGSVAGMTDRDFFKNIKFIDDHPSSSDEFLGHPHESVADTLVSVLTSGEGGRAIGLEGTWGSGKSTVVDIARLKLENQTDIATGHERHVFFVFDAWAHQGDPLRRVFLLELIRALEAKDAIPKSYWEEQLEALQLRRRLTTETRAERLSIVAKAVLITLPLLPIAYSMLLRPRSELMVDLPLLGVMNLRNLAFVPILVPYLFALVTWLTWREGWRSSWKVFSPLWWRTRDSKAGRSVIWAFTRQTDHTTTDQSILEKEATTFEFNEIFDKLIASASERNFRVVIVFDNLDRLPSELIQSSWATMRNFFATSPGTSRQTALKDVWLIVPFDRAHIEAVFARDRGPDRDKDVTPGFIEKTFEIVLRVPPPILSNWRAFLSNKLRIAFGPTISDLEIYQIFKIYELYNRVQLKAITPRAIKAFVNTIAVNARQWGKLIPLEHQALFGLYKEDLRADLTKLQDSTLVQSDIRAQLSDTDWVKSLAAAHFNVGPDAALEFLLAPEIVNAIRGNDIDRLAALSGTTGFALVLHNVIAQSAHEWATQNPSAFLDTVAVLAKLEPSDESVDRTIWRTIVNEIRYIHKPVVPTELTPTGLRSLMEHCDSLDPEVCARDLIGVLSIALGDSQEPTERAGRIWFQLVAAIADALPPSLARNGSNQIFSRIPIPASGLEFHFGVTAAAADSEKVAFGAFVPAITPDDFATGIIGLIDAADVLPILGSIVKALVAAPASINWPPVVAALQRRLQTPAPTKSALVAYQLLNVLALLAQIGLPALRALSDDGSLLALLQIGMQENNADLIALSLYDRIILREGQLNGPNDHPQYGSLAEANNFITQLQTEPKDPDLIDRLARLTIADHRFSHILKAALPVEENREIYRAILRKMVELGTYNRLAPTDILVSIPRVGEILGIEKCDKLLRYFDTWEIDKHIDESKWKSIAPDFLRFNKPLGTKHYSRVVAAIIHGITGMDQENWITTLNSEDNILALLFCIIELGETLETGPRAFSG
jgi:hypothetical protein